MIASIISVTSIASIVGVQGAVTHASAEASGARSCAAVTRILTKASAGLLMPSESDFPFTPFTWTGAARRPLTIPRLLELTAHAPETTVEVVDLRHFLRNVAFHQPWHDRQQTKDVRRFQRLVRALERHLTDVRVYRVGTIRIDVYVVGRCGNDLTGLQTVLIET